MGSRRRLATPVASRGGTLPGPALLPLRCLSFLVSALRCLFRRLRQRHRQRLACSGHTLAAFEQGAWLEELELLQLAQTVHRSARQRGGYDARAFDLVLSIADVLEAEHGWSTEQSEAWLERLGVWEEEL